MTQDSVNLRELTASIAAFLGAPWKHEADDEPGCYQRILGTDDAKLYLQQYRGRVTISGSLTVGKNNQYVTLYDDYNDRVHLDDISVAISRGPAVIAAEIKRRLLPEYLRILTLAQAKVKADNNYRAGVKATLIELAAIVNANTTNLQKYDDSNSISFYTNHTGYGDIQAGGDTVSLNLHSLPIAKAKQLLKLLGITPKGKQ